MGGLVSVQLRCAAIRYRYANDGPTADGTLSVARSQRLLAPQASVSNKDSLFLEQD